jgi:hypothetical protein
VREQAGWYPDSDRLGERYWNGEGWEGFRVRKRHLSFVVPWLIWVYIPIATVWIAAKAPHLRHPSCGLRTASVVIGLLTLIPTARALRCSITITPTAVTDRGVLRTRRFPLHRIQDAFVREPGPGPRALVLRLAGGELAKVAELELPPEVLRVCLLQIRGLLPTEPERNQSLPGRPDADDVTR